MGGIPNMYHEGPRRPISILPVRPQPVKKRESTIKSSLLSSFQSADGDLDIDKIIGTGKQVMNIYNQVSPYVSKFIKK